MGDFNGKVKLKIVMNLLFNQDGFTVSDWTSTNVRNIYLNSLKLGGEVPIAPQ